MSKARVGGDWLEGPDTQAVLSMLSGAGFRGLVVGGCVRNALMDLPVTDVDIATDAPPQTVIALSQAAGLQAVPTGLAHGTVTIIAGGKGHEVTTFRDDIETDGRHARVAFSTDLRADAARRDFTMNALYAQADGQVLDPLGIGLADLRARRLRFVGVPADRITEDYLRILRFFRFSAYYSDPVQGFDADALAACAAHGAGLQGLSHERVGAEMRKLLDAPDPGPAIAAMDRTQVLARVLPGARPDALARLIRLEAGEPGPWLRRLAALGGKDPAARFRLSRAEARALDAVQAAVAGTDSAAVLGYRLGAGRAVDAVLVRAACSGGPPEPGWQDAIAVGARAVFPLRPADLMPALTGPALGAALERAKAHWLASGFRPGRDALQAVALGDQAGPRQDD